MEAEKVQNKFNRFREKFDSFSYKGVVLNVPFMIFIAILALAYISNNNNGVAIAREIEKKTKILEEVRWKYKDAQANLIYNTTEKQINDKASAIGISPLTKPAFEIKQTENK